MEDIKALRQKYVEVMEAFKFAEQAKESVVAAIKAAMGDQTYVEAGEGTAFELRLRQTKEFDKASLRKYLDEDQLETVLKPDGKKVKSLLKELNLTGAAKEDLEKSMILVSESRALTYVEAK